MTFIFEGEMSSKTLTVFFVDDLYLFLLEGGEFSSSVIVF